MKDCKHTCDLWSSLCCRCSDKRPHQKSYIAYNNQYIDQYSLVPRNYYYCKACKDENGFLKLQSPVVTNKMIDKASQIILSGYMPTWEQFRTLCTTTNISDFSYLLFEKKYFFFVDEIKLQAPDYSIMRHLTLYRDGFYDYLAKKEYKSLSDWAADNGKTLSDIVYGLNRYNVDGHYFVYAPLGNIVKHIDPTFTPNTNPSMDNRTPSYESIVDVPVVAPEPAPAPIPAPAPTPAPTPAPAPASHTFNFHLYNFNSNTSSFNFDELISQIDNIRDTVVGMKTRNT